MYFNQHCSHLTCLLGKSSWIWLTIPDSSAAAGGTEAPVVLLAKGAWWWVDINLTLISHCMLTLISHGQSLKGYSNLHRDFKIINTLQSVIFCYSHSNTDKTMQLLFCPADPLSLKNLLSLLHLCYRLLCVYLKWRTVIFRNNLGLTDTTNNSISRWHHLFFPSKI